MVLRFLIVTAIAIFPSLSAASPKVVATIKPLHSLVSMIADGFAEPQLLMSGQTSPHDFSLRPSQAKLLAEANVTFWIGPTLESSLQRSLENLGGKSIVISFVEAAEREGDHKDEHDHAGHDDHKDEHNHEHEGGDPHIWLNPNDAIEMLGQIETALAKAYPEQADLFAANSKRHRQQLLELQTKLKAKVAPYRKKAFVTFHDAYTHFAEAFDLTFAGALTVNPAVLPSAKKVSALKAVITENKVVCAFAEPQFPERLVQLLTNETAAKSSTLDPLGSSIAPGKDHYTKSLEAMVDSFVDCMKD